MDRLIKNIFVLLYLPFLGFHIISYFIFKSRCKTDIDRLIEYRRLSYGGLWAFLYLLVHEKPYRNLFYHRIGHISYFFMRLLCPSYPTLVITTPTKVGSGFIGEHPFATIVNANTVGKNFLVRNNVTIGVTDRGKPTIGDNVTVNVQSVVIGNITIGDNVIIGAGSVVTKDVPSNSVVVGNPAKIIRLNGERVDIKL